MCSHLGTLHRIALTPINLQMHAIISIQKTDMVHLADWITMATCLMIFPIWTVPSRHLIPPSRVHHRTHRAVAQRVFLLPLQRLVRPLSASWMVMVFLVAAVQRPMLGWQMAAPPSWYGP